MLGAATGGRFGGGLARVARGAQYGAARGQRAACYMETYGRGYLGVRRNKVTAGLLRSMCSHSATLSAGSLWPRMRKRWPSWRRIARPVGRGHTDPDVGGVDRTGMTLTRSGTPTLDTRSGNKETAIRWWQPGTCLWVLESNLYREVGTGKQISAVAGGQGSFADMLPPAGWYKNPACREAGRDHG